MHTLTDSEKTSLEHKCRSIKLRFLKMYFAANAGHVGCSLSCAEILTFLRFGWMGEHDEMVLSKGHAAACLYSLLAEAGVISEEEIATFYKDGTFLAAHPPPGKLPGIRFGTGSLGHGLSLAAGVALAKQMKNEPGEVFCITSDGELNEGSIWEAALFAAHHRLASLRWFIDRNQIQGFGRTEDVLRLEPLADKLRAFGWDVFEASGHDFASLAQTKSKVFASGAPSVVICHTRKGKDYLPYEDTVDCHYLPMSNETFQKAFEKISGSGNA